MDSGSAKNQRFVISYLLLNILTIILFEKPIFAENFETNLSIFFYILAVVIVMVATKIPTPWSNPIRLVTIQTPRLDSV